MEYYIHLAILVCMYAILAQSFNLSFGLARQFNLAHVACYSIGAYVTSILSVDYSLGAEICIPLSMILSGIFALSIGAISTKLKSDYFAIGSLAFAAIVSALTINWKSLTRGVLGIPGIPRPELFGLDFYDNSIFLGFTFALVIISYLALYLTFSSKFARQLRAQADFELGAMSLGIHVARVRNVSFMIAAAFAGLAGSCFAYYINYIDPSSFGLHEMIFVLSIVIIGRPGSFWGATLACIFLVLLPEPLRQLEISPSVLGPMRQMLYSLILFAVVYWKRHTIFPHERTV